MRARRSDGYLRAGGIQLRSLFWVFLPPTWLGHSPHTLGLGLGVSGLGFCGLGLGFGESNVGAITISIGFWGLLYAKDNKEPQNSTCNYLGP